MSRTYCEECLRPQIACICVLTQTVLHHNAIRFIQHYEEQYQAKGTGRLSHLCLQKSEMQVVPSVCSEVGNALSRKDVKSLAQWHLPKRAAVLFPADHAVAVTSDNAAIIAEKYDEFIVIDGTWRQANKLLNACSTNLDDIPCVTLSTEIKTEYSVLRKTKKEGAFSSLEACYHLLKILEPDNLELDKLMQAFTHFIDFQQGFRDQRAK